MGKKRSWVLSAVKKALTSQSNKNKKKNKDKKSPKPKRRWFRKRKRSPKGSPPAETEAVAVSTPSPPPPAKDLVTRDVENHDEQDNHAQSIALATAAAAEAAVAAVQAAAEVVRLTAIARSPRRSKPNEEVAAAIRIQTAFRGYLARRALSALRGLARLKSRVQGNSVKQQATSTLHCMQTLARLQSQIRTRRIAMSEENRALERHLQQKCEKELEKLRLSVEENWNDSIHTKEELEAKILNKQDAAMRRERALAYAHSHQILKNQSKSANPSFMDPNNPHWGWSWLERWMAARPWENTASIRSGDLASEHGSMKSATSNTISVSELSNKSTSCRNTPNRNTPKPSSNSTRQRLSRVSPSTPPPSKARSVAAKASPRSHHGIGGDDDDDARSTYSFRSEQYRRHSNAGSSVRDDESIMGGSPALPSYMLATESARAKSRTPPSPLGNVTPERLSVSSVKKRASRPSSPAGGRRSGLSRMDMNVLHG